MSRERFRAVAVVIGSTAIGLALLASSSATAAAGLASSSTGHGSWKSAACRTDVATLQTAVDAFLNDHLVYPNGTGPTNSGATATSAAGQAVDVSALVAFGYLHSAPASNERFAFIDASGAIAGYLNGHKRPCASE